MRCDNVAGYGRWGRHWVAGNGQLCSIFSSVSCGKGRGLMRCGVEWIRAFSLTICGSDGAGLGCRQAGWMGAWLEFIG
jgi:hypothetical protein